MTARIRAEKSRAGFSFRTEGERERITIQQTMKLFSVFEQWKFLYIFVLFYREIMTF